MQRLGSQKAPWLVYSPDHSHVMAACSTSSHAAIANGGHPAGYRGAAPHGSAAMSHPQQLSSGGDGETDADEAVSSSGTAPAGQSHTSSASEDELVRAASYFH